MAVFKTALTPLLTYYAWRSYIHQLSAPLPGVFGVFYSGCLRYNGRNRRQKSYLLRKMCRCAGSRCQLEGRHDIRHPGSSALAKAEPTIARRHLSPHPLLSRKQNHHSQDFAEMRAWASPATQVNPGWHCFCRAMCSALGMGVRGQRMSARLCSMAKESWYFPEIPQTGVP